MTPTDKMFLAAGICIMALVVWLFISMLKGEQK
jgi:hypothetical protein